MNSSCFVSNNSIIIEKWLVSYLSNLLDIKENEIDRDTNFIDYGLDSATIVVMTTDIANWVNQDLNTRLIYDNPTVVKLSEYLSEL